MSKLKKIVAGALAAVVCATSFSAPAPATADAATYCCHTIYYAGTSSTSSYKFCSEVLIALVPHNNGTRIDAVYADCKLKTTQTYKNYKCYKCPYSYKVLQSTTTSHTRSH